MNVLLVCNKNTFWRIIITNYHKRIATSTGHSKIKKKVKKSNLSFNVEIMI